MDVEERRQRAQAALDEAGARTVQLAAYVDYLARFGAEDEPLEFEAWADEFGAAALGSYRLSLVREETYRGIMRRLGRRAPTDEEVDEAALASVPEWFFRSLSQEEE